MKDLITADSRSGSRRGMRTALVALVIRVDYEYGAQILWFQICILELRQKNEATACACCIESSSPLFPHSLTRRSARQVGEQSATFVNRARVGFSSLVSLLQWLKHLLDILPLILLCQS